MLEILILIVCGVLGASCTFALQKYGCSAVVASCVVGLVGALVGKLLQSGDIPLVAFAGSFVGMTSAVWGTYPLVVFGGALTAVLYYFTQTFFAGFGGRLGALAFISTVIVFYVLAWFRKLQ